MNISQQNIDALRGLVECEPRNVVVLSHTNPDGDAIGSSLAWAEALRAKGHSDALFRQKCADLCNDTFFVFARYGNDCSHILFS